MKRLVIQDLGKKLLLSLAAVSFLAIHESKAQSAINLGVTLGPNYGNLASDVGTWTGSVGFQGGMNLEWRYNNKFGIALEGQDINLTTNSNYSDSLLYYNKTLKTSYNTQLTINFLQSSLLFKYYVALGSKPITPYDNPNGSGNFFVLMLGPYYSIVGTSPSNTGHIKQTSTYVDTSQHTIVHDSVLASGASNTVNTYNGLATSTYGVTLGAGLNLKLSRGLELTLDFRYSRDLVTIDNPLIVTDPTTKIQTNYGFLGQRVIVVNGTTGGIQYVPANAFANFICFNVGLNVRLFELGGAQ